MKRLLTCICAALMLTACSVPVPKYKAGDVVYSCVGHIRGQVVRVARFPDRTEYSVRFMTVSMEENMFTEAELCRS